MSGISSATKLAMFGIFCDILNKNVIKQMVTLRTYDNNKRSRACKLQIIKAKQQGSVFLLIFSNVNNISTTTKIPKVKQVLLFWGLNFPKWKMKFWSSLATIVKIKVTYGIVGERCCINSREMSESFKKIGLVSLYSHY